MTITTEEAEALARQADELGYPLYADGLRTLAAERDIANKQIHGLAEERERWKARSERAEAEAEKMRKALKPFAKAGELFPDPPQEFAQCIYRPAAGDEYAISGEDLRRARAALEGGDDGQ